MNHVIHNSPRIIHHWLGNWWAFGGLFLLTGFVFGYLVPRAKAPILANVTTDLPWGEDPMVTVLSQFNVVSWGPLNYGPRMNNEHDSVTDGSHKARAEPLETLDAAVLYDTIATGGRGLSVLAILKTKLKFFAPRFDAQYPVKSVSESELASSFVTKDALE